jgi:HK97 family phage major capsid protein
MKKKLKDLLSKRSESLAQIEAIEGRLETDGRDAFTLEEKAKLKELKTAVRAANDTIAELQETRDLIADELGGGDDGGDDEQDADKGSGKDSSRANNGQQAGKPGPSKADPAKSGAATVDKGPFPTFGHFLQAVAQRANPGLPYSEKTRLDKMFEDYSKRGGTGSNEEEGPEGGYAVKTEVAGAIWERAHKMSQLAPLCTEHNLGSNANRFKIPAAVDNQEGTFGGMVVYWVNEGETAPHSRPTLRYITVDLNKLLGFWYTTDELLSDAPLMESLARNGFGKAIAWAIDKAIIKGTGVGEPLGITKSPALVTVTEETSQDDGTVVPANVTKMAARLHGPSWSSDSLRWVLNPDTNAELPLMTFDIGTAGVPVYMPSGGLSVSPYGTLLGKPIMTSPHLPAKGQANDMMLIDFAEYLLLKKGGIAWDQSMHVNFNYDEHCFRVKLRIGGQPMWDQPFTPAASSTTSPYVALGARTT